MTNHAVTTTNENAPLAVAGQVANHYASQGVFEDFLNRKAYNTRERYNADLNTFRDYLTSAGVAGAVSADFMHDADAWHGVTWGLVAGFVQWQLQQGFAVGTVNVRTSTVKTFARLASKAGTVSPAELTMIRTVERFRHGEQQNVDATRDVTRKGNKKAQWTKLSKSQVDCLKEHCHGDTPQARRDCVLIRLLLDLGLRVSEVVALKVNAVDLDAKTLTFYRAKVGLTQKHALHNGLFDALTAYITNDVVDEDTAPLLRKSNKSGSLSTAGLTRFGIAQRIADLGVECGIEHLSPHDLRHAWATSAAKKTPLHALMSAGGWASPAMPMSYIDAAQVANEGVVVEDD